MHWIPSADRRREREVADRLRASSKFYRFLWEIREELFAEGFEEALLGSYEPRGQEPCPPALLAMVMLLQRYEGLSDARAVDAAENDRRWQLVLGTLDAESAPFGQESLVRFRTRMVAHDLDKMLVDRTVQLAKKTRKFGWQKLRASLDSSPLHGEGRVEDTWNLIGRAMSKVVRAVSRAPDVDEDTVIRGAKLSVLRASSIKTALDIDWDDEQAQRSALTQLVEQASRLDSWVTRRAGPSAERPPLSDALEVMRRVVDQDTEPDPSGGGTRIRREVPHDRIISVSDIEMRHGRKSKTKLFNGYKRHIATAHRLILGTAVEPANLREHEPTDRLLDAVSRHGKLAALDIDRGYLPAPSVAALHEAGVAVRCRPWKHGGRPNTFTKEDFRIDLARRTVTCPAGNTAKVMPSGAAWFAEDDCSSCPKKPRCTSAPRRTVTLHPQEALLIELRRNRRTKPGRAELPKRTVVEHRLARIAAIHGTRARYKGARKNELDLNRAAAIANLQEIARLRGAA